MSRRKIFLVSAVALLALAVGASPAHAIELAPPTPHSPNAEGIRLAYWVTLIVVLLLIIVVNAALIAAVVRYRGRRGREPRRVAAGRGALRPVIGALSALALALFIYGVIQTTEVRQVEAAGPEGLGSSQSAQVGVKGLPASSALESATGETAVDESEPTETSPLVIDAIAQQWVWRFEYPGGQPGQRTFTYGELVVPVDTPVILDVTSTDVLHTWWVPALGGQVQAAPGDVAQTWFKADEVGRYEGRSTIFAGTGTPVMRSWVKVVTVPEYQDYIEQLTADLTEAQGIVSETQEQQQTSEAAAPAEEGS